MIAPVSATSAKLNPFEQAKLQKGAQDFEAMMLQQMWKGMRSESEDSALTDMGLQAMSTGVAKHGGLGIGKMLERSLK